MPGKDKIRQINADQVRAARVVFYEAIILFECPFCGRTLVKTDYDKIRRLLEDTGPPRGAICAKCNGAVMLKLGDQARRIIESKHKKA